MRRCAARQRCTTRHGDWPARITHRADGEGEAVLDDVLAAQRHTLGVHQDTVQTLETLAVLELDHARYQRALDHAREAAAMFAKVLGDGYNPQAELFAIGRAQLGLRQLAPDADTLERARTAAAGTVDPNTLATIDWMLGRALVDSGHDRARGLALVTTTWPTIAADERLSSIHAELAAWMAAHGLRR